MMRRTALGRFGFGLAEALPPIRIWGTADMLAEYEETETNDKLRLTGNGSELSMSTPPTALGAW